MIDGLGRLSHLAFSNCRVTASVVWRRQNLQRGDLEGDVLPTKSASACGNGCDHLPSGQSNPPRPRMLADEANAGTDCMVTLEGRVAWWATPPHCLSSLRTRR